MPMVTDGGMSYWVPDEAPTQPAGPFNNPGSGGGPFASGGGGGSNMPPIGSTTGGGGGGGGHTSAAAAPPAGSGYDPSIVLGPDGNVYGYLRTFDAATGGYGYQYKNFGAATDLNAVSAASGMPVGMVQQAVQQQQNTLNTLAAQGAINPNVPGGMTQQQLTQQLDAVRTAQQYQSSTAMQQIDPATGATYAQEQSGYDTRNASFQYQTQGQSQQASAYGWQRTNDQGANYNSASGVGGMTYGQLGLSNDNSQAQQQYAYGQNYDAANPYSGMSNGATGLAASNASNASSLAQNQYNLGTASYTNGQTRQQYSQGTQDLQNQYDRSNSTYQLANQGQQQALSTYRQGTQTIEAQNAGQSRNISGMGFSGITRPQIAGQS